MTLVDIIACIVSIYISYRPLVLNDNVNGDMDIVVDGGALFCK